MIIMELKARVVELEKENEGVMVRLWGYCQREKELERERLESGIAKEKKVCAEL